MKFWEHAAACSEATAGIVSVQEYAAAGPAGIRHNRIKICPAAGPPVHAAGDHMRTPKRARSAGTTHGAACRSLPCHPSQNVA